jgi:hypothetical protein
MAVRLSALRAGRPLPPWRFLVLIFVRRSVGHSAMVRVSYRMVPPWSKVGSTCDVQNTINNGHNRTSLLPYRMGAYNRCKIMRLPLTSPVWAIHHEACGFRCTVCRAGNLYIIITRVAWISRSVHFNYRGAAWGSKLQLITITCENRCAANRCLVVLFIHPSAPTDCHQISHITSP